MRYTKLKQNEKDVYEIDESKIQEALNKLQTNRTTIAIAHRLSTLKDVDSLAVINDGKVVETGSHDELMKLRGEYHKLYTIQMEGLKVISMDQARRLSR